MAKHLSSAAVMARRHMPREGLDDYPTPPWATRALLRQLSGAGRYLRQQTVWEPAANRGHMVRPLQEVFNIVLASDIHDYGMGHRRFGFLRDGPAPVTDWIITNPPFTKAADFALRALDITLNVALLCRLSWLEGKDRWERVFRRRCPSRIFVFSERVSMTQGRLQAKGNSATAFAWFQWDTGSGMCPEMHWIPPGSRAELERSEDYG